MTEDWPFTPEVETGGWQIAEHHGRYWLDEDYHERNAEQEAANVSLIAAAPRLYKIVRKMRDVGFEWPELDVLDWIDQQ